MKLVPAKQYKSHAVFPYMALQCNKLVIKLFHYGDLMGVYLILDSKHVVPEGEEGWILISEPSLIHTQILRNGFTNLMNSHMID